MSLRLGPKSYEFVSWPGRPREKASAGPTWLYIIAEDTAPGPELGPVKVGISNRPFTRLSDLQAGCPKGGLYLLRAFGFSRRAIAQELERSFHQQYKDDQRHREWFDYTPERGLEMLRRHVWCQVENESEEFRSALWADTEDELTDLSEFA